MTAPSATEAQAPTFFTKIKESFPFRCMRAFAVLTATALVISAIAISIFYAGPYMCVVAISLLHSAKWLAILSASCLALSVVYVALREFGSAVIERVRHFHTSPRAEVL